ncbi:hypothetical protein LCGC14_1036330 [marine sediment metagenome]|uniref:Uncharacterized protein n=1 Tax=marine sediment metagenome TaxID=412755 RepID=A0A0F9NEP3_9ZZZZ
MQEDFVFGALESLVETEEFTPGELLVVGAVIGAGFGCSETARNLLLQLCLFGDFSYDKYKEFVDMPSLVTILDDAESDTELGCILRGMGLGAGFSDSGCAFRAVASLSELAEVSYSSDGPREDYRGVVPSYLQDGDDTPEAC